MCEEGVYTVTVECCRDIMLKAGLIPATSYDVIINRVGSSVKRRRTYIALASGEIVLLKSRYTAGVFSPCYMQIEVREMISRVPMNLGGKQYTSIVAELVKADGNYSNVIE